METEKPITAPEVVPDSQQNGSRSATCLNCDTPLTDVYCPHCGQKNIPRRLTLGDTFMNFISSFWSYESKFFLTGRLLMFKPGQLAKDYNEGKRERYYHPARMYVFISFVFFALMSTLPDSNNDISKNQGVKIGATSASGESDTIKYKTIDAYREAQQALPEDKRHNAVERFFQERTIAIEQKYGNNTDALNEAFFAAFQENLSKIFFFLLPVFALVLKLLYVRRGFYYSEHLVFSVYYYNFFFLIGSVYLLVDLIPFVGVVSGLLLLWILVYLLLAMKRAYQQSWKKTILKYCTFMVLFSFCILTGIFINLVMTLMSL